MYAAADGDAVVYCGGINMSLNQPAAAAGSMSSEHLDHYEEGTWTPAGSDSAAATVHLATYTKIGRQVFIIMDVTLGSESGAGDETISGLPFASPASHWSGSALSNSSNTTASNDGTNPTYQLIGYIGASEVIIHLAFNVSGGHDELSQSQASGKRFRLSMIYHV